MPFITEIEQLFIQRFYSGWMTLRSQLITPIRLMGRRVIELYDALLTGNDWEVTPQLTLKRRAGHTLYSTINAPALNLYSWKSNTQGTIPIIDTTQDIEYVGTGGVAVITTKGVSTGQNLQSSILGVGNYLYVGNPQVNFKWDGPAGTQGKTNWGISIGTQASGGSQGPTLAGTGSNSTAGTTAWSNPSNVTTSGSSYATLAATSSVNAKFVVGTNFSFSVPSGARIVGIQVSLKSFVSAISGFASTSAILQAQIFYNGSPIGNAKNVYSTQAITTATAYSVGSAADSWGINSSGIVANNATFGVGFIGIFSGQVPATATFNVNDIVVTVFYGGSLTVTPTGSGSFSAINGFTYVYAYGNSQSGEISNAGSFSNNTGPFSNVQYVGVPVQASTDSQVDQIRVYRTTDSGGGNQFFELPNSPFTNTTATIQDAAADTTLQVASQAEINLGNTPPPVGLINLEWFSGRMWGSVGNVLFASTGPETISGTAPNSNWNPSFQFLLPQPIVRNIAGPNGMMVFTVDDCYMVRGTDITNYTINEFIPDFGVRSYNAIDTDGTNFYIFTSDRQFVICSASGVDETGLNIGDQLLNVDPSKVYVKVNRFGLDSIVRILDTVNNVYYDYNQNQQCWNLPGILAMPACSASGSIETSAGVWRLLLCSTKSGVSSLAYRDITNFQDLGTAYACNAVFGSIQLADPGMLAKIGARGGFTLEYTSAGSVPTLSVLPNDTGATLTNAVGSQITGTFASLSTGGNPLPDPPTLANQPTGYRSLRYYWSVAKGLSAYVRHLQFQISAVAENQPTELLGFCIFGDEKSESPQPGRIPELQGK